MSEQTTKPPTTAQKLVALQERLDALDRAVTDTAAFAGEQISALLTWGRALEQTTDEQFSALRERLVGLEARDAPAQERADPFIAIAALAGQVEQIQNAVTAAADFDPGAYVRHDELGAMPFAAREQARPCTQCSCTEFREGHPSGIPTLCLMCNHELDSHRAAAA